MKKIIVWFLLSIGVLFWYMYVDTMSSDGGVFETQSAWQEWYEYIEEILEDAYVMWNESADFTIIEFVDILCRCMIIR
jgi:hypothetical protein